MMPENRNIPEIVVRGPAQVGHAIRRVRDARGIDQATLAERADLHRTYVSKVENDTPGETLSRLLRMLAALDLELVIRPRGTDTDADR